MSKMMDIQCNVEFPTEASYFAHKKSGHKTGLDKATPLDTLPIPTPPPGVQTAPSPEFMEIVNRIEAEPAPSNPTPSQHPTSLPPADPIRLEYVYTGVCPDDRSPVTTLEIDVASKHFAIAFCGSCKKQLENKEVSKL